MMWLQMECKNYKYSYKANQNAIYLVILMVVEHLTLEKAAKKNSFLNAVYNFLFNAAAVK